MTTTAIGWLQLILFTGILIAITKPLGKYLYRVFEGERTWMSPVIRPVERLVYRFGGVEETSSMSWGVYALALLAFSLVTFLVTYFALLAQGHLPLNPMHFGTSHAPSWGTAMTPDLAFNTAVSFTTNTNWQAYSGENTMSYFSQMVALASHNFFSAAAGIAIAVALARGLGRGAAQGIGNFWVDMTRATVYVLLPLCLVYALVLCQQGVIQNFHSYVNAHTVEGATQIIPGGPIASQEAIKMLGTNGGGFLNANSAHPFENPTPLTNFPADDLDLLDWRGAHLHVRLVCRQHPPGLDSVRRDGVAVFARRVRRLHAGSARQPVDRVAACGAADERSRRGRRQHGRQGECASARWARPLFATVTTDASCGAVNSMHDSFTPLGGLVPMANIMSGEVIFGGVGAGLYGMLMYAILAVFIAGLMVGRTPEYLGKKVEAYEVKMAMVAALILAVDILGFTALSSVTHVPHPAPTGTRSAARRTRSPRRTPTTCGPHGFSEILYVFDSATGNNGSAFAGMSVNTPYWNLMIGLSMLIGRFLMIIPLLAIAGSMAAKKRAPVSAGTFPTDNALFGGLLVGTVVIVGALAYFPAVALGPIVEHVLMHAGRTF